MSEDGQSGASIRAVEEALRAELVHGDGIIAAVGPVLRQLVINNGRGVLSDAIIAGVRGMMTDLAEQALRALFPDENSGREGEGASEGLDALATAFLMDADLLSYAHGLAIEAQIVDRLKQSNGIDPVLSVLLQELMASSDEGVAAAAMKALAKQARFIQQQRRMELPLAELPQDLFESVLAALRGRARDNGADAAVAQLRAQYDPADRRVAQFARLLGAMEEAEARRALEVDYAGVSLFITALQMASGETRHAAAMSLGEDHAARLALNLRVAGLGHEAVAGQFLILHPEMTLLQGFDALRADRAAALLAEAQVEEAQ